MRNVKTILYLELKQKVEVEPGVWEWKQVKDIPVKATHQGISDDRRDRNLVNDLVVTARFKVRSIPHGVLEYCRWRNNRYKVSSSYPVLRDHYSIIELGEMV